MKRKLKQRWSTIPAISTKGTITSHFNALNTKKTMTYDNHDCFYSFQTIWQLIIGVVDIAG
jgi:hypothetical protein